MTSFKRFVGVSAALLLGASGTVRAWADPAADEWIELPVVINLYNGCSVTAAESKEYIKRANEVLKQAKIKLTIAKTNENFMVGNNDANQAESEDDEAIKKGKKELEDNTKGKGIKINFCDRPIASSANTNGWAIHKTPVIFVRESDTTEKSGNTVAHEICHVLTIDYDLYAEANRNRLMYGYSSRTGTELTDAEKEEIRKEAAKRGTIQKKQDAATPSTPKRKETSLGYNTQDASPDNFQGVKDASITSLEGDADYECRLVLGGEIPPGQGCVYHFLVDIDNNPATGVVMGDVQGVERGIMIQIPPDAPFAQIQAMDLQNPSNVFFTEGSVILEMKWFEGEPGAPTGGTPDGHVIDFSIPIPFMGLGASDIAPVIVGTGPMGAIGLDRFMMLHDTIDGDRGPHVSTDDGEIDAAAGETFTLMGAAFDPGATLEITLDDEVIGLTTAGPAGGFAMAMTLDPGTPTDTYFLTVQDLATGAFGFAVIDVLGAIGCPADLSGSADPNDPAYGAPDGVVDAADFFYYLDQFVAGNLAVADLSGSPDPNDPAYGVPDGVIDAADFFYYLDLFVAGCP